MKTVSSMGYAILASLIAAPGLAPAAGAQDTSRVVTVGGFVDFYYAWDFNKTPIGTLDRSFTTQPARHDEFNVNLAHIELKLSGARTRGRVALQAGTSVQSNYAGEPRLGAISGPELARHIQEATAGLRVTEKLWIDGGIYLSHIGQESWISRDNPTYTRSLIADYSPYYETGVKATLSATSRLTIQLLALNGWQNISETNDDKAAGLRLDYVVSPNLTLGYSNFIGNEQADTLPSRVRVFNEGFAFITTGRANVWLTFDYGIQKIPGGGSSKWYGGAAIGKVRFTDRISASARVERYADPDGVIVASGAPAAFKVSGGSIGLDVAPSAGALWRTEVRGYQGDEAIFVRRSGALSERLGFVVSSLALTF